MQYVCTKCDAPYDRLPEDDRCTRCFHFSITPVQPVAQAQPVVQSLAARSRGLAKVDKPKERPRVQTLDSIKDTPVRRIKTGMKEFDSLIGGGLVPKTVWIWGGDAGGGKTSLAFQVMKYMDEEMYFMTAEEMPEHLSITAKRLDAPMKRIHVCHHGDIDEALAERPASCRIIVVNSLQKFVRGQDASGLVSDITAIVQQQDLIAIIISRLNRSGHVAGSADVEFEGDATLMIRKDAEDDKDSRRIMHIMKNRFGPDPNVVESWMTAHGFVFKNPVKDTY